MLIVITIISIIGLIAMPVYNNYIATSREGVLVTNITTIEIFQEDFRLRNGAYAVDLANIAAITAAIGWDPQAADGATYVIADGDGTTYSVTGTDIEGRAICIAFPARTRC
jgi:type II secretory pathway pseudopilin PulG